MMSHSVRPPLRLCAGIAAVALVAAAGMARPLAQSDLDAFMHQVLDQRDTNWRKLQQYVLDEREQFEMRGPSDAPLWGERREYTWFIRDGFFVRSPLRVNGGPVSEADRQKYEQEFLDRAKRRDARADARSGAAPADPAASSDAAPRDLDGLIRQSRQPQFISSAYFLRFRFESGKYALVGREPVEGQNALRIEYYPSALFREPQRPGAEKRANDPVNRETRRLMNKVSIVTLWVDPAQKQILKYTFDNVSLDFLPTQWFTRVTDVKATMTMGQAFPGVWLPKRIDATVAGTLAVGQWEMQYATQYLDYRRADVGTKVLVPR